MSTKAVMARAVEIESRVGTPVEATVTGTGAGGEKRESKEV